MSLNLVRIVAKFMPGEYAWRVFFFLGFAPALFVLWIRLNISEAGVFAEGRQENSAKAKMQEVFAAPYRATTSKAVLLTFGIYGSNYVMITWLPAYLKMVLDLSIANVGGYLAINILGAFAGA